MDDTLLRGHTCLHCQKLNLCEELEKVFICRDLKSRHYPDTHHMRFTGLRLDDLQEGARSGCSLGKYLSSQLGEGYPEQWSPHDLKLYTDDWRFWGLIPLEKTLSSDQKLGFPMKDHYVHAPSYKGYGHPEFLSYNLTTDQEFKWSKGLSFTRKPISTDPLSDITAATIRDWKARCDTRQCQSHTICSRPIPRFLPSRLIEIVRISKGQKPCVRLIEGNSLEKDTEYTALSYCWGGDLKNCLKESNKDSYRTEVPWEDIPRTIQDAILTSHKLGIGFIWVDSLCIIQDRKGSHKEIEIGQMTQVYTHAAFTIAAKRAPDAHTGFLHPRSLPSGTTVVEVRDEAGETRQCILTFQVPERDEDQNFLDTRGWTLQEYILSRRLLIIGSLTTVWSCRKEREGNCDGWSLDRKRGDPFWFKATWIWSDKTVFKNTHRLDAIAFFGTHPEYDHPRPDDRSIRLEWKYLVELYTRRNLTRPTDRILAISGLAQIFSRIRGGKYAAGLWVNDLPQALLWETSSGASCPRPSNQGPSWSWTAINRAVTCDFGNGRNVSSVDSIEYELDQPGAPFGSVKCGTLRVTGPALDLEWKCSRSTSHRKNPGGHHLKYLTADGGYINANIKFCPDAEESDSDWATVTLLAIKTHERTAGLVLRKKNDTDCSRLGFFNARLRENDPNSYCQLPVVKEWGSRTFTIV
ncbi:related to tol protein [Fusarium proliferatum]|nr:related to tol protein [Fusarium proliferatum]